MGLTGFVLKDLAAIISPVGFTLKGIHKEMLKSKQPTAFIRRARITQGQRDMNALDDKAKQAARIRVAEGWSVIKQVWDIMDEHRSHGLRGRAMAMRERKTWRMNGAFGNVDMAAKALKGRRAGDSLDSVFAEKRAELERSQEPRKNVVDDIEHRKTDNSEETAA